MGKSHLVETVQNEARELVKTFRKNANVSQHVPNAIHMAVLNDIWQMVASKCIIAFFSMLIMYGTACTFQAKDILRVILILKNFTWWMIDYLKVFPNWWFLIFFHSSEKYCHPIFSKNCSPLISKIKWLQNIPSIIWYVDSFPYILTVIKLIWKCSLKNLIKEHEAVLDEDNPRDYIDNYLIEMRQPKTEENSHMSCKYIGS